MIIGRGYVKYKKLTGSNIWVNVFSPKALRRPSRIDHARKTVHLHMLNNILTIFLWLFCTTPQSYLSRSHPKGPLIQYMLCGRCICTLSALSPQFHQVCGSAAIKRETLYRTKACPKRDRLSALFHFILFSASRLSSSCRMLRSKFSDRSPLLLFGDLHITDWLVIFSSARLLLFLPWSRKRFRSQSFLSMRKQICKHGSRRKLHDLPGFPAATNAVHLLARTSPL